MLIQAVFGPLSLVVMVVISVMIALSLGWFRAGERSFGELTGGLAVLRRISGDLAADHPVRRRLEAAPVAEISLEELAQLLTGRGGAPAAEALVRLQARVLWIERFAQFAVHLGILGTVLGLVLADPSDMTSFRAKLPIALGTTFWGLIGALALSALSGASEGVLHRARFRMRKALLASFDKSEEPAP